MDNARLILPASVLQASSVQSFEIEYEYEADLLKIVAMSFGTKLVVFRCRYSCPPSWGFHWDIDNISSQLDIESVDARDHEPLLDVVRTIKNWAKS